MLNRNRGRPYTIMLSFSALLCYAFCALCGFIHTSRCLRIDITSVSVNQWDIRNDSEEIRCYCNLPVCISTSYMCKSEGLGCFSDLIAYVDVNKARHGCLDLLERERQTQCQNEPSSRVTEPQSLLLCCHHDLCNHVDSPETKMRYNDTILASSLVNNSEKGMMLPTNRITNLRSMPSYSSAEVWFRAATIAVPICGALILFILIALAVRILRSDAMEDRVLAAKLRSKHHGFSPVNLNGRNLIHQFHSQQLSEINSNTSSKKLPLLFQHNESSNSSGATRPFIQSSGGCTMRPANHGQHVNVLHSCHQLEKNETNAKLNYSQNSVDASSLVHNVQKETQTNLIDLHKSTSASNNNNNCNLFQQEPNFSCESHSTCALLSTVNSPTNSKLTYKKPLVVNWTEKDVNPS